MTFPKIFALIVLKNSYDMLRRNRCKISVCVELFYEFIPIIETPPIFKFFIEFTELFIRQTAIVINLVFKIVLINVGIKAAVR